ncbi:hypothetical protein Tco_1035540 [Tanacetum coccineum]
MPQPSFNQNYMQQPMLNPEDILDPTTAMNMELVLMAKAFKLNYSTPTNNNQRISSNPRNRQIAQPGMNLGQDRQMHMVGVQNLGIQNVGNQNGLIVVTGIANQNGNDNVVAARAEEIQLQAKEFDFMAAAGDLKEIEENDNNVISAFSSVEQYGGTVEQNPATLEETRAYFESLYINLAIELARYKNQEKCFEINKEKLDKLERCYQKSVYQEQSLNKTINALHLSSAKTITTLNEEIANLNNQVSKEKSTVSFLQEEKKKFQRDFKTRKDELLDKQIQLEKKIKELDNILVKTEKHDPPAVYDSEETLQLVQESRLKMKELNKEINQQIMQRLINFQCFTKLAKFVRDFKSLAKEADESLAKHKALEYEIERLLKAVVSQDIMSIMQSNYVVDTSNLQTELDRTKEKLETCIIKKEKEYVFLWNNWYKKCEECKYDKISYDKAYNVMQQKIERLQAQFGDLNGAVMKCFFKKHLRLERLNNIQMLVEPKSQDTRCVSDTLDPLSQKLENENAELEFQVLNYAKENEHLKTTYKNLFDSIKVTWAQTKLIMDSLQEKLHDIIYENATLRAQLFDKVSEKKDTTKGTGANTKFENQSTMRKPLLQPFRNHFVVRNVFQSERLKFSKTRVTLKVVETNDLENPVTSNSDNPFKTSREDKFVPINKVRASVRTNPITISQPHVITKKDVNSDSNGLSSIGVNNTAKTIRQQPRSNTKNDRVLSASKSSCIKNKEVKVEEYHRNVLLSKNKKHMSSECKNIKLAIQNDKFKVVCAMCKQCLITSNHDVCVLNYVNDMNSRVNNLYTKVSNTANKKKHKHKVKKPKMIGSKERLALTKPSKPVSCLRWSPTGRVFDLKGKIITSSESEC